MCSKINVKSIKTTLSVTTAGFEPARPCEHQPLKLASLPFLHVALKKYRDAALQRLYVFFVCDLTGSRTQDPNIKSDVLYQLSYQVFRLSRFYQRMRIILWPDWGFPLASLFGINFSPKTFVLKIKILRFYCDHDGIRTHTPFRAPAPQAGKSTVSPRGLKKERSFEKRTTFCDPTGARTQDPIIKSDVLYQLSYRVDTFKKN